MQSENEEKTSKGGPRNGKKLHLITENTCVPGTVQISTSPKITLGDGGILFPIYRHRN